MSNTPHKDEDICETMVTKIAKLARLRLTDTEATRYKQDFEDLLAMFHELDKLPKSDASSASIHIIDAQNCREDVVSLEDTTDNIRASCKHYNTDTSYFDVPQFIEQE